MASNPGDILDLIPGRPHQIMLLPLHHLLLLMHRMGKERRDSTQEYLWVHSQQHPQGPIQQHQMPHQDRLHPVPHMLLGHTLELQLDSSQQHQMPQLDHLGRTLGSTQQLLIPLIIQVPTLELLLGKTPVHQKPHTHQHQLAPIQEHLQDRIQGHLQALTLPHPLANILQALLGPMAHLIPTLLGALLIPTLLGALLIPTLLGALLIPTLLGALLIPTLLGALLIPTLLGALLIPILQGKHLHLVVLTLPLVCRIQLHMVSQVLHLQHHGALVHGDPKVGSTLHPQICHTQLRVRVHTLLQAKHLVLCLLYHGGLFQLVNGVQALLHILELLGPIHHKGRIPEASRLGAFC
ncbi:uncharacterized protein LOC134583032 [Pelobates fuscus]|uniref:uncharacterized protein LOC134583032 n=1 Tax=Pelobates fuscus TaxID=191477 RepID=UPI002FE4BC8E